MSDDAEFETWERLEALAQAGDARALADLLESLPAGEGAWAMAHLEEEMRCLILTLLFPEDAAGLLEDMPWAQAADAMEALEPKEAAAILAEMTSDERADVLTEMEDEDAAAVLASMEPEVAEDARQLASYEPDTAGGLMISELLSYREDLTVSDVTDDMRANAETYADYDVQYAYVVHADGRLAGVLRLRDLVLAPPGRTLLAVAVRDPLSVRVDASLDQLEAFFDEHGFLGAPVIDEAGELVGVVRAAAVQGALGERSESDHLKVAGIVGGEELRSMPVMSRALRRLSWLSPNILLNILAASVIAIYQDTLESVIALAVFLPIISDMSGCSGNQAVAVSMRELSLGLVKPGEVLWVWGREVSVGIMNGLALGLLLAGVAVAWQGNLWLGLVVGGALAVNTVIAVSVGGVVPLALKRFGVDPALASGPVLTTVTDMCGFFLVLNLATMVLHHLR